MITCLYGSVLSAGVNADVSASVGSLVKIKLIKPAGNGWGLREHVDVAASEGPGIQKLQLVWVNEPLNLVNLPSSRLSA